MFLYMLELPHFSVEVEMIKLAFFLISQNVSQHQSIQPALKPLWIWSQYNVNSSGDTATMNNVLFGCFMRFCYLSFERSPSTSRQTGYHTLCSAGILGDITTLVNLVWINTIRYSCSPVLLNSQWLYVRLKSMTCSSTKKFRAIENQRLRPHIVYWHLSLSCNCILRSYDKTKTQECWQRMWSLQQRMCQYVFWFVRC